MAGIDKTYTDNWTEYKALRDWIQKEKVSFTYGNKKQVINLKDFLYEWEESDFDRKVELPVFNTPTWMDIYLLQHCPVPFVIERIKDVYGGAVRLRGMEIGKIPFHYKKNRKISIIHNAQTKYPLIENNRWLVQVSKGNNLWYNPELDAWVDMELFPWRTNTMTGKSIKGIIRRLRKMYLPKEIEFSLQGRHIGERYTLKIK